MTVTTPFPEMGLARPEVAELSDLSALLPTAELLRPIAAAARPGETTFSYLGRRPFGPVWELQKRLHKLRAAGEIGDVVLFLEHEPVYTLGKHADRGNLLSRRPADVAVIEIDRGGEVTYHGPGQLVGYPIIDLRDHRMSVSWYLRGLEQAIIAALATWDVPGEQLSGLTGVWIQRRKVAALGVRLARWTTTPGFAVNLSVPPACFDGIVPCGILDYGVTNLNDHLPIPVVSQELAWRLIPPLRTMLED